jgi:Fic family protein
MPAQTIRHYEAPHQFEPLMPEDRLLGPLLEQASDLIRTAATLSFSAAAQEELRTLLRAMNSYYTNRIEGEHARPIDLERALLQDFSADADVSRRQRLAIAHMETEMECERGIDAAQRDGRPVVQDLYSEQNLRWLHRALFSGLQEDDLRLADGTLMLPGELRPRQVAVGRHEPPLWSAVPRFIARWGEVYGGARRGELTLVAAAASHHRLAWIHPFLDGNGRVARLHTHLVLHAVGLTKGLWSPLRGYARTEERYRALLQAADEHRRGDLDGRGNLTQQGLIDWIEYTIATCIDQVQFMAGQLDVAGMQDRMRASLTFDQTTLRNGVRIEALRPLHYLFATQSDLSRAEFKAMTGLGDRLATQLVSSLLATGYLASDSAYGRLRFAVPRHALRLYFPNLWPEAERDREMLVPAPAPARQGHDTRPPRQRG